MFYCKMFACLAITAAYGLGLWQAPASPLTFALGIPACGWLMSLLHELGHLAAYRLAGLKWKRLAFLGLVLESGKGLSVDPRQKLFSASCTCAYDPAIPYRRYRVALLGGGFTALLLALAAFTVSFFADGALRTFCICFAFVGGVNAFVNLLLPFSADRKLLRQIRQDKSDAA